jgi:hypothetical protein
MATDEKMKIDERYQYLQRMQRRYRQADRSAKSALLDEMEAHTGMHRKALLRRLHSDLERKARSREREPTYGPEVDAALALIWEASDYVCPERLQPNLVSLAELLARHSELDLPPGLKAQLAQISFSTVRRHLPPLPLAHRRRRPAAPPNRHQQVIPAYRIPRDTAQPGHFELDLVHHGGDTPEGEYVYTLQLIDVATAWSGRRAILGRSYIVVADALAYLFAHFPFPVHRIHPDNGSEFLNAHLLSFLRTHYPHVVLARSRPRHPNDNRLVEQKNDTLVRQFLGTRRFDTVTQTRYLNTLYTQMDQFYNFIQPVMKQIDKTWVSTHEGQSGYLKRTHDQARSPLQRLCDTPGFDAQRAQALRAQRDAINPLLLRRAIYAGLDHLFAYPNAQPDQVQDVFQTLADPDLFPEAVEALRAVETVDKPKTGLPTVPTAPTATMASSSSRKEAAMLQ